LPQVYVRTSRGASISLRRVLGGGGALQFAYRPELTRLESEGDVIFCVNFVACEASEIDQLRSPHWLAPVTLSYAVDKSNSVFEPTRGTIFRADLEYAGPAIGSDFAYDRFVSELTHYSLLSRGVVLATRIRPGVARATDKEGDALGLHPQKRFFAGGPNSVRGYAQYRLGPKLLTINAARFLVGGDNPCTVEQVNAGACPVAGLVNKKPDQFDVRPIGGAASFEGNAEIRFPLIGALRGVAFMDFGQVWKTADQASFRDLAWSPGTGIRYSSPIGPIRVDVGYNTRGSEQITVVTTQVVAVVNERTGITTYENTKTLQPLGTVKWDPYHSFTSRLQFHFSIGQAF
jgi:outer membrane protein assembly factor BamA